MKKSKVVIVCLAAWLLVGCAATSEFLVSLRAVSNPNFSAGTRYVLLPGNSGGHADREFEQYAGYVRKVLTELGYTELEAPDSADIVVLLSYGLDTSHIDLQHLFKPALYVPDGTLPIVAAVANGSTNAFASPYSEVNPLLMPVSAVYRRWLSLEAFDAHATEKVTLWKIMAIERGYLPDLDKLFPIMLAACKPYIGRTTDKVVVVHMREDDEQVKMIKGDSDR